jgi:predicted fused transcriptional regulator/phosphomethylpyrimidine kinase/predicted transcriptional regulator
VSLHLPSEIVVERFLPTARAMLAAELDERGLAQREVAQRLGVSQAAVSQYLAGERPSEPRFADHPRMQETVARIADGFADGTMDEYEALAELLELVRAFEDRGPICAVHEEEMPALEGMGCDLCVRGRDPSLQAERDVLANVRRAVRQFADAPGVVAHVPNVGTNVAMALPDASDETDVAAVPGRLHAMRGRVNVPSDPEFGASRHVARTVLAAMDADERVRGAVNVATGDALLAAAREAGYDVVEFDAGYEDRAERLRALFASRETVPRVAYHEGAFGIEPITYVLGETAVDAVERARALVEASDRQT